MPDVLQTTAVMMPPARRAKGAASLAPIGGAEPSEAILQGFMGVSASHLELAFTTIDERAGGLEPYLAALGADAARLERLRAKLLA